MESASQTGLPRELLISHTVTGNGFQRREGGEEYVIYVAESVFGRC